VPTPPPNTSKLPRPLFDAVGRHGSLWTKKKHGRGVTGLSASGPAFAYIILESLCGKPASRSACPRDVATLLAAQTMKGSASVVLETGDHPALLKDSVTTPAGCTIDGHHGARGRESSASPLSRAVGESYANGAGELLFEK